MKAGKSPGLAERERQERVLEYQQVLPKERGGRLLGKRLSA
jgi:hypothetical protein